MCSAHVRRRVADDGQTLHTMVVVMVQGAHPPRPFFLSTNASAYGVGAVLSQEGEINPCTKKPTQQPIAYYSATFTPTERNYDIYECKLLAVIKALTHW